MKKPILLLLMCITLALPSCDKSSDVRPAVSIADLPDHYFVFETSAGNLRVDYFYLENDELKGLRDGLDYRRGLESIMLSGDTLRYTINSGSTPTTYMHVIKKEGDGKLTLEKTATSTPDVIAHCEMQPVAEATPFDTSAEDPDGSTFRLDMEDIEGPVSLVFSFNAGQVWMPRNAWAPYYSLNRNIGWKGHSERAFGVAVSTWKGDDSIDMLVQSPLISQDIRTTDGIKSGKKIAP